MQSAETTLPRNRTEYNGQRMPVRPPVLSTKPPAAAQPADTRAAEGKPHGKPEPDALLFRQAKAAGSDIEAVMRSGRIHRGRVLSWGLYSVELLTDDGPVVVLKVGAESFREVAR